MNASIIITFYNKGKLILKAIESVIGQISLQDEIIVVNDSSNDKKSLEYLETAKEKYNNIKFLTTEKNKGASYAKDFGIRSSKNEIIILLDADDKLPTKAINNIKKKFLKNPNLSLVYGNYVRNEIDTGEKKLVDCSEITRRKKINPKKLAKNWILLGSSPFLKSAYLEIGGFDKLYPKTDDVDFHRRLITNEYKCGYINNTIYIWNRYNNGNNSNHSRKDSLLSLMRSFEFYLKYLSKKDFLKFIFRNAFISIYLKIRNKNL
jgi:glycosyltransferase involved in cell wall biosynthesis